MNLFRITLVKKSNKVLDLGCNNGEYSKLAINSGCERVIGLDYDLNAIDEAYLTSKKEKLNFLPFISMFQIQVQILMAPKRKKRVHGEVKL